MNKKISIPIASTLFLSSVFLLSTSVHADTGSNTWTPRTVEQIKKDIEKTNGKEYTIVTGDTLSAISQATNISIDKLSSWNNIGNVNLIFSGNKLVFDGNIASVKNSDGKIVSQTVIQPEDKTNTPATKDDSTANTNKPDTWKIPSDQRESLIHDGGFSAEFVDNLSKKDYDEACRRAQVKLDKTGVGDFSRVIYELQQMFPGSWSNNQQKTPQDQSGETNENNQPTGAWVQTFKNSLYQNYGMTPKKFKYIGNNSWEVWVNEVDTGNNPYVTVNSSTGKYHG